MTGAEHGAATSPDIAPMASAPAKRPAVPADAARCSRPVGRTHRDRVEHGERGEEQHVAHDQEEPRVGADAAEQGAGEPCEEAEPRVDGGQPDDVGEREQGSAAAASANAYRATGRLPADDRRGDRDHRIDARREGREHAGAEERRQRGEGVGAELGGHVHGGKGSATARPRRARAHGSRLAHDE
jgi:hypothetical protein